MNMPLNSDQLNKLASVCQHNPNDGTFVYLEMIETLFGSQQLQEYKQRYQIVQSYEKQQH